MPPATPLNRAAAATPTPSHPHPANNTLPRSRQARAAEGRQRFSDGLKIGQLLPHTQAPGAGRLAALLPALAHLSIDERASCLGGMTNCLGAALGSLLHALLLAAARALAAAAACLHLVAAGAQASDTGAIETKLKLLFPLVTLFFPPAARALGASCPKLQTLEVFFDRYSLPFKPTPPTPSSSFCSCSARPGCVLPQAADAGSLLRPLLAAV